MNYFQLFDIAVKLKVDKNEVRRKYLALSKKNHPDYFVNESGEEQQKSLEIFSLLNKALKTFTKEDETIRYVLQLKGLLEEEEKYALSPAFLMQMMEVNEELSEATEDPSKKAQLFKQLTQLEKEIYEPVQDIVEKYKEGDTTEKELLQVKDYYFRKKCLDRIRHQFG